jgi:hypothetical protein
MLLAAAAGVAAVVFVCNDITTLWKRLGSKERWADERSGCDWNQKPMEKRVDGCAVTVMERDAAENKGSSERRAARSDVNLPRWALLLPVGHTMEAGWKRDRRPGQTSWPATALRDRRRVAGAESIWWKRNGDRRGSRRSAQQCVRGSGQASGLATLARLFCVEVRRE